MHQSRHEIIHHLCRMLIHGKLASGGKPETSQHDIPVIEFEPIGLFGVHLAPATEIASVENFRDVSQGLRTALTTGGDLKGYSLQMDHLSSEHLSTDIIEVAFSHAVILRPQSSSRAEICPLCRKCASGVARQISMMF